jgi:hypothetical protein
VLIQSRFSPIKLRQFGMAASSLVVETLSAARSSFRQAGSGVDEPPVMMSV